MMNGSGVPACQRWPLERALLALAGTMTLLSAALAALVSPWFLLLAAAVGLNQWAYVVAGTCPAAFALTRLGLRRGIERPRHGQPADPPRSGASTTA